MIVRLSGAAVADLEEIGDRIAADDPAAARRFVSGLTDRCLSLARHPLRFPVVRRIGDDALRKLSWRGYLIFYRVGQKSVEIVRIAHGSRDWAAFLGSSD
ncbi:MAG TPA: type II toxin-antitoxin system RelE/ParE family toxin [Allosphingosinicella sp.]|nr:type II toxin-antitoxin system RelE/ParE family toxin [Allosphingosinicella sp.]